MALDPNEIVAAAPVAPAVEEIVPVTPVVEEAEVESELPDEVLQIPLIGGLLEGKPAAIYEVKGQPKIPGMEAISKNINQLANAGLNLYQTVDGTMAVLFNTQFLSLDKIKEADKSGTLTELAEPAAAVASAYDAVLGAPAAPAGGLPPSASPVPQSPNTPINKRLTTARLQNLDEGSPTSGPVPGGGRVLSNVLKRAV